MKDNHPSLLKYLFHQHIIAVFVTLFIMLLTVLFFADHLVLKSAAYNLLKGIREIDQQALFESSEQRHGGRIILDLSGNVADNYEWEHQNGRRGFGWRKVNRDFTWAMAPDVIAKGELYGMASLPWIANSVVWAARLLNAADGNQYILVVWNRTDNVRGALSAIYYLIIITISLAFLINIIFLSFAIKDVTRSLDKITSAGRKMVTGDFAISIPPQSTIELNDLRVVITNLAQHLDHTLSELKKEQLRLTNLEQAQRRFVADASHELRAPLSAMIITLDAWQDGLLKDEEKPEALAMLRSESKRLGRMVAQLLDLSLITSGRQVIKKEPVNIREVSINVSETMINLPGAAIDIDIPDGLPNIIADRDALHRILRNLLDNAIRFTPTDGKIGIWAKEINDMVKIGVTDTGSGIPQESIDRMWDRFTRIEHDDSVNNHGTGLGLAIVKALVEAMNGSIGIDSKEGEGTTVWIYLKISSDVIEK